MLPKGHLTLNSRMSDSRQVITLSWLSGSWRSFLYSSVYSYHLFSMSFVSVRSIPFLSFIVPIFAWNIPLVSLILLKISLVFPILLFPSISVYWSLREAFSLIFFGTLHSDGYLLRLLLCLSLLFFSQLFVRPHQKPFCLFAFLFLGDALDHCLLYNVTNLCP